MKDLSIHCRLMKCSIVGAACCHLGRFCFCTQMNCKHWFKEWGLELCGGSSSGKEENHRLLSCHYCCWKGQLSNGGTPAEESRARRKGFWTIYLKRHKSEWHGSHFRREICREKNGVTHANNYSSVILWQPFHFLVWLFHLSTAIWKVVILLIFTCAMDFHHWFTFVHILDIHLSKSPVQFPYPLLFCTPPHAVSGSDVTVRVITSWWKRVRHGSRQRSPAASPTFWWLYSVTEAPALVLLKRRACQRADE